MLAKYPDKRTRSRIYRIGAIGTITELPSVLEDVSPHFMLFLAVDATDVSDEVLRNIARKLLDHGLAGLSVWGKDCSRVHDQFDVERNSDEPDGCVVETTWHDDEPLEEALWSFANVAYPDDCYARDCNDWVAVAVGSGAWEATIRDELVAKNAGWPP